MKYIKKTATVIALIILALVATTYATNTDYLLKAIRTVYLKGHVTAFLDDYHAFDNRTVQNDKVRNGPSINRTTKQKPQTRCAKRMMNMAPLLMWSSKMIVCSMSSIMMDMTNPLIQIHFLLTVSFVTVGCPFFLINY